MAAKLIQIKPEDVLGAARDAESSRLGFRASYQNIYREVNVLKAGWLGAASDDFAQKINAVRGDFELMDAYMGELIEFLNKTCKSYKAVEHDLLSGASYLPDLDIIK